MNGMKKIKIIAVLISCLFFSVSQAQIDHTKWNELLIKHVDANGKVNYKGFIKDKTKLEAYLKTLSAQKPSSSWSKNEQLAFWINAYNAFTVKLIVDNYPVESIKDLGGKIYRVNTPWDIKFIEIGGEKLHLNDIEHNIIRKEFDEPRIHFALVCAAASCPKLRNEAYVAARLTKQLDDQAVQFLADDNKNKITSDQLVLSKLFKWYSSDFPKGDAFIDYLNQFTSVKIQKDANINWMDYDWRLNE